MREMRAVLIPATSTGTTIVGLKFGGGDSGEPEGVCLGADTRATAGPIVADKNCEKVGWDGTADSRSTISPRASGVAEREPQRTLSMCLRGILT